MFNIHTEVNRLQQLKRAKIHGIPPKPKQHNPKVKQVDDILFNIKAEQDAVRVNYLVVSGFYSKDII